MSNPYLADPATIEAFATWRQVTPSEARLMYITCIANCLANARHHEVFQGLTAAEWTVQASKYSGRIREFDKATAAAELAAAEAYLAKLRSQVKGAEFNIRAATAALNSI